MNVTTKRILSCIVLFFLFSPQTKADEQEDLQNLYNIFVDECAIILEQPDDFVSERLGLKGKLKLSESQDKGTLQVEKEIGRIVISYLSYRVDGKRFIFCLAYDQLKAVNGLQATVDNFRKWISTSLNLKVTGGQTSIWGGESHVLAISGSWPKYNAITRAQFHTGQVQFAVSVGFASE
ncbi:MAG: hypothetical protein AAF478_12475 [Pseudomonadota bacterium]